MNTLAHEQPEPDAPLQLGSWTTCDSLVECRAALQKNSFLIAHSLASSPLFSIEALLEAAQAAAKRNRDLYFDSNDVSSYSLPKSKTASSAAAEIMKQIETAGAWVRIKHLESDPNYKNVLDELMAFVRAIAGPSQLKWLKTPEVVVFMTSPRRLTACHFDRELNFLCQIHGSKEVWVGDPQNTMQPEIERHYTFGQLMGNNNPQVEAHAKKYLLSPGYGVHIPSHAKHWVKNLDEVSVSASLNFDVPTWFQDAYRTNYCLRRIGLVPRPPNPAGASEKIKAAAGQVVRRTKQTATSIYRMGKSLVRR